MRRFTRFLIPLALLLMTAPAAGAQASADRSGLQELQEFTHGVASGDVTESTAVLWTRTYLEDTVTAEVFDNPGFEGRPVFRRAVKASVDNDLTAQVTARRLEPATTYYYRWLASDVVSPTGTFTTAPAADTAADVRFAYSGDSDGTRVEGVPFHGNFEVLDAARAESPDFFAYLGDTIYSDSSLAPEPAITLDEYRAKYKENREIDALPDLLKSTSVIAQWDDHEVMNDYDGQTVDPERYATGREAFFEYMPVNTTRLPADSTCAGDPLFRTFRVGRDVELFIPDERSCRSASVEPQCLDESGNPDLAPTLPSLLRVLFSLPPRPPRGCVRAVNDPRRTMLGPVQKRRLKRALINSDAKFKLILSELAIQQFWALPYDRWEGYGAERAELLNFIRDNQIENVVFLTTDNHATIMNEVAVDAFEDPEPIAEEMVTGPIATFTMEEEILAILPPEYVDYFQAALTVAGVDCRNINTDSYGMVDVSSDSGTATITLKDENGTTLTDDLDPSVQCTKTIGG